MIIFHPRPYGQYDYSQPMGYSSPGMMQPQQPYTGQIFQPTQTYTPSSSQSMYGSSFDDEPPLLEGKSCIIDALAVTHSVEVAVQSHINKFQSKFCVLVSFVSLFGSDYWQECKTIISFPEISVTNVSRCRCRHCVTVTNDITSGARSAILFRRCKAEPRKVGTRCYHQPVGGHRTLCSVHLYKSSCRAKVTPSVKVCESVDFAASFKSDICKCFWVSPCQEMRKDKR